MMITDIEDYFTKGCGRCARFATPDCSTRKWIDGLNELRQLCLDAGLEEAVKWGHPCYIHNGQRVAIIGAFRQNFRLTLFDAGLLADKEGLLVKQGPNSAWADAFIFGDVAEVGARANAISAYLAEAKDFAARGMTAPKPVDQLAWPEELGEALDADPELAEAFHALTPGRQRSYVFHVKNAKKAETRFARIEKSKPKILAGKGQNER